MAKKKVAVIDHMGQPVDAEQKKTQVVNDINLAFHQLSESLSVGTKSGLSNDEMLAGLTEEQQELLDSVVTSAVASGAPSIQLPLGVDFKPITFTLQEIPFEDIERMTTIHKSNVRKLEYFSEFDKLKAVEMLKLEDPHSGKEVYANTNPALGCRPLVGNDDRIQVFDGLRRRFGCLGGQCTFKIYVTDEPLTDFHARLASSKNNDHLANGFFERREEVLEKIRAINTERQIDDLEPLSDRALEKELKVSKKLLGIYKRSVTLPDELLCAFPSPTSLGSPSILLLIAYCEKEGAPLRDESKLEEVITKVKAFVESMDVSLAADKANAKAMDIIKTYVAEKANKPKSNTKRTFSHGSIAVGADGSVKVSLKILDAKGIQALMKELNDLIAE